MTAERDPENFISSLPSAANRGERARKFYVETFGCQMNTADSEEMGRSLLARGYAPTENIDEASVVLVNTCTVRDHAEHKAVSFIGRLKEWKDADPSRRLVVAGCAAERLGASLSARFGHVDLVVGAKSVARFDEKLAGDAAFDGRAEARDAWSPETDFTSYLAPGSVTAHVTIMRGCNYSCTYCIVPAVRGREVYRPAESVLAEVAQKAAAGFSEMLLLGQTVNSYKPLDGADFADLLRAADRVPGVRRLRFMSPHPFYVDEKLSAVYAETANVCPHIHLPAQSGSDAALKRMRRNYTRAEYLRKVALLRRARPDIAVTTDLIAGFPGETEAEFAETLSLADEAGFDAAYCFKYSARPGTEAAALPGALPEEVVEERHARLLEKTAALSERNARRLAGTRQEVLVDRVLVRAGRTAYEGRNRAFWKISFESGRALKPGDTVEVVVTEADGRAVRGKEAEVAAR